MSDSTPGLETVGLLDRVESLGSSEAPSLLWTLILVFATLDTVLTVVGIRLGLTESNPIPRAALSLFGAAGLVGLKLASLLLLVGIVRVIPGRFRVAALLGFCLPQAAATGVNTVLIVFQAL